MMRCQPFPLLPGFSVNTTVGQTRFHKSHHFDVVGGQAYITERSKPGIGGAPLPYETPCREPSIYPGNEGVSLPTWLVYDKQILSFDAYLRERMAEYKGYNYLIRKCKILFFLEDGTIKVVEKKNPKSPFPQAGCIISRQKINLPNNGSQCYDIVDFNIGKSVELIGRVFHITDCDKFTRIFLNRLGIPVTDPLSTPDDPIEVLRLQEENMKKKIMKEKKRQTLDEFLASESSVLSFDAYWDDRKTMYGYVHLLKLRFFLADLTTEIKDVTDKANPFTIVRRGKLVKEKTEASRPGDDAKDSVLNVMGEGVDTKYILDPLNLGAIDQEFYTDRDLAIGAVINAFGKRVVIYNCDDFTKRFYQAKYGLDEFTPLVRPKTVEEQATSGAEVISQPLPPHNGIGTHEDSALNCVSITPSTITKSYRRFYEKDKEGYDSKVLRFAAKLVENKKVNERRNFIICFFPVDETITVYETRKLCAQNLGSAMMTRRKMYRPGETMFGSQPPLHYDQSDFFLGNMIVLESHHFLLVSADEYALRLMELNSEEYPKSNYKLIMDKIREKVKPKYKEFASQFFKGSAVPNVVYNTLRNALLNLLGDEVTEQEIITVARKLHVVVPKEKFSMETLRRLAQDDLKKKLFDDYCRLRETFRERDSGKTGRVSKTDAYIVLRAARLPLDTNLINTLLDRFSQNDTCTVPYCDLLYFLDYKKNPSIPVTPINIPANMSWMNLFGPEVVDSLDNISVELFLKDLGLEEELKAETQ